jgi:hypothetical protein
MAAPGQGKILTGQNSEQLFIAQELTKKMFN